MKKYMMMAAAMTVSVAAMAQNDYFHIFRNDKNFNSFKGADVESIQYTGTTDGFTKMVITGADGKTTEIEASAVDSVQVTHFGLPEIHVTLNDYPEWTELMTAKDDVHPAQLYIIGNGMMDDLDEQTVEFRGRGNSTWNMAKKPYRFKRSKKTSLAGMAKAKTYALIANYIDCSLMRNTVALWVANYLQMPYANHCVPVRVYLNGIFKGAYMMTEKIGIGGGSVDINEETGILFELDSNYDEDYKFQYTWRDGFSNKVLPVMVKDPDFTEVCPLIGTDENSYLNVWKEDFTKMADAIVSQSANIGDYIDLESAADFFIVNSLANNHEMKHPKSFYIHKADREEGTKYVFGPVWDFDWAFTFDGYEGVSAAQPLVSQDGDMGGCSFLKKLFANQAFRTVYKERWDRFVKEGYPELLKYMEEYANTIEPSAKENGLLWPADYSVTWRKSESSFEFRKNFEALKKWIGERIDYCNSNANFGLY